MNSNLIEKIKKLLALAQSENTNERDAAMAKAMQLATDNQIDLALLDTSTVGVLKEEPIEKLDHTFRTVRRIPVEFRFVASIVRTHFNVEVVWGWRGEWTFIGRTTDVAFAKWLTGYLLEEFVRRWDYYRKTELADLGIRGLETAAYRNTYLLGLYRGLNAKLRDAKEQAEAARFSAPTAESAPSAGALRDRYALVVQNHREKLKAATAEFFPSLRSLRSRGTRVRSHGTLQAGIASGRTISCNRPLAA